jgi:hypothetical protein
VTRQKGIGEKNSSGEDRHAATRDANNNPIRDAYTIAWQGIENDLWIHGPTISSRDTGAAMAPHTDPSITRNQHNPVAPTSFNYCAVFQGRDGNLWSKVAEFPAMEWTRHPMAPGTSPRTAFIGIHDGVIPWAYQTRNGTLYLNGDTGLPMMAGTSRACAADARGRDSVLELRALHRGHRRRSADPR